MAQVSRLHKNNCLIKLEEFNVDFTNDNFEIEVFEMTSSLDLGKQNRKMF